MFVNKTLQMLHIVRFRNSPLIYMTTTSDMELSLELFNHHIRHNNFANREFQQAYNLTKVDMGLLDPNPDDILMHQFLETASLTGYQTGHWLIRDYLAKNNGLHNITNIGDWLDDDGFVDITPPDQDKRKFVRVTDIGKYYAEQGCFDKGVFPLYILSSENNQINASGLIENHRNEQPKRGGYDTVVLKEPATMILSYNDIMDLGEAIEKIINEKPIMANGRLYSSIDQFARARNLPTWFIYEQIDSDEGGRYVYAQDWHFV